MVVIQTEDGYDYRRSRRTSMVIDLSLLFPGLITEVHFFILYILYIFLYIKGAHQVPDAV